jgi:hypothetical protein
VDFIFAEWIAESLPAKPTAEAPRHWGFYSLQKARQIAFNLVQNRRFLLVAPV